MAWIGGCDGSNGGEERKRRKIEELESKKRSLIPRSCSSKNTEEARKIEDLESEKNAEEIEIRNKYGPQVGDTVDILDLLFTNSRDFLIKSNGQKVNFDDLNGKTIVLCMLSMPKCTTPLGIECGMMDLVDSYNELRVDDGVEFVFVPKIQGDSSLCRCYDPRRQSLLSEKEYFNSFCLLSEEEYFNGLFSKTPWPAVPFSNKHKCDTIKTVFWPSFPVFYYTPYYAILDPNGKILVTNTYPNMGPDPSIFHLYGGVDLFSISDLSLQNLQQKDKETIEKLDLDQLLASPYRDFLLGRDGTKVPISSLRDKVVGLYFCDNIPTPPRMEALKKVYQEAMDMGYDFQIVQINFHFLNNYKIDPDDREMALEVCCEAIPWLTLPFKDICCRRLRRLFKLHKGLRDWKDDSLVIIDQHKPNVDGTHFERFAIDIVEAFGIEAYPFTRIKVFEMEHARMSEVKLHTIFPIDGPPLIRPSTSRGCDQVPRSELLGKRVLVLFTPHSEFGRFESMLGYKYSRQSDDDRFEVIYVSCDTDESSFDECTKEMPWLVHPYSWEFAERWRFRSESVKLSSNDSLVAFDAEGEFIMCTNNLYLNYGFTETRFSSSYPFLCVDIMSLILDNVGEKYDVYNFAYIKFPHYPRNFKHLKMMTALDPM